MLQHIAIKCDHWVNDIYQLMHMENQFNKLFILQIDIDDIQKLNAFGNLCEYHKYRNINNYLLSIHREVIKKLN